MIDQVREALNRIKAPDGQGLVDAGYVQGLVEDKGLIRLVLEAPADRAKALVPLKAAVEEAVKAIPGVEATQIITTTQLNIVRSRTAKHTIITGASVNPLTYPLTLDCISKTRTLNKSTPRIFENRQTNIVIIKI